MQRCHILFMPINNNFNLPSLRLTSFIFKLLSEQPATRASSVKLFGRKFCAKPKAFALSEALAKTNDILRQEAFEVCSGA